MSCKSELNCCYLDIPRLAENHHGFLSNLSLVIQKQNKDDRTPHPPFGHLLLPGGEGFDFRFPEIKMAFSENRIESRKVH